jgi:hypothetical protein
MAANIVDITANTVALVASTAKTVLGLKAATNQAVKVLEMSVSFDGATSSNAPAVVEFATCTFVGQPPGTGSTSVTATKREPGRAETTQLTAARNWTPTEPTAITPVRVIDIGQYNGVYHYIHPFASPHVIAGGGGAVIRITSPNNVNFSGHMTAEE